MTSGKALKTAAAVCLIIFPTAGAAEEREDIEPSVFKLGEVLVVGYREADAPAETRLDSHLFHQRDSMDISDAASLLPEAAMARAGTRNEKTIRLRGFDMRQVPFFIDGIPVYLPYDGMADPGRFGVFDLSELSVCRGFSPVIFGPNTLGGAINAVSLRPPDGPAVEARSGFFNGDGYFEGIRASASGSQGYIQGSATYRKRNFFRVSGDFTPTSAEDGGRRENSDTRDLQLWFKGGWTPSDGDEYAFGFMRVDSEKGVPPYAGTDSRIKPRYWRYTDWTKNSLYFIGHKDIGLNAYVKPRLFYDTYENTLDSYDDKTCRSQTKPYAFRSIYEDYTFGGVLEACGEFGSHVPRAAAHYKQDVHREHYEGQAQSRYSDYTLTLAVEDGIRIAEAWRIVAGIGWDRRASLDAVDRSGPEPVDYPDNANDLFNPQCGLFYDTGKGVVRATAARKSRLPTMKDRYSYRRGTAIPNPDLKPETADHYEIGYSGEPFQNLDCRLSFFYSRLRDAIQEENNVQYDSETDTWLSQYRNVGEADHKGLEAGLSYRFAPRVTAGIDYALLHMRNISRPELEPTDAPPHRLLSFLEIRPVERLAVIPNVEYNSSRYSSSDGVKVDWFWLCNLDLTLALPEGLGLSAGVRNIFDEDYELSEGYAEEGRNYHAEINCRF